MAKIANPVKSYKYSINFNGVNQAKIQSVTVGKFEIEKVMHHDGGVEKKTPGMPKVGDIDLEKLIAMDSSDSDIWEWFSKAFNYKTGQQSPPSEAMRDGTISLLDGNENPVRTWIIENAWVCEFEPSKLADGEGTNSIDKVKLCVDNIYPSKI